MQEDGEKESGNRDKCIKGRTDEACKEHVQEFEKGGREGRRKGRKGGKL